MKDFILDFWNYLKARKKFVLAPIIIVFALIGALIIFSQATGTAPFIYTIF